VVELLVELLVLQMIIKVVKEALVFAWIMGKGQRSGRTEGQSSCNGQRPDRQAGGFDRPGEPGTVPVWGRRWLEPGRNGRPRLDAKAGIVSSGIIRAADLHQYDVDRQPAAG